MSTLAPCLAIFAAGVALFTLGLWDREFIRIHARYGLFMKEMLASGTVGLHPTLYGTPYPDYYSTQVVLSVLCAKAFGGINFLSAVLPSAVASALCLVLTYLIGLEVSRKLGICGVLLCLMTYGFMYDARSPTPDMFIAAIAACCFYLVLVSQRVGGWTLLLPLPVLLVAGFAFRGPIGVVVPAAVVFVFYLMEREWRKLIVSSLVSGGVLVVCALGVAIVTRISSGGNESLLAVLDAQVLGRIARKGSGFKAKPLYFYVVNGMWWHALAFPLAVISLALGWWSGALRAATPAGRLMRLLAGWFVIVLVGLSVPGMKQMRYIIPLVPAAALLGAFLFIDESGSKLTDFLRKLVTWLLAAAPFICVFCPLLVYLIMRWQFPDEKTPLILPSVLFAIMGMCFAFILLRFKGRVDRELLALAAGAATFAVIHLFVIEPTELATERSKPFVTKAEAARGQGRALVFWKIDPDGDTIKYLINVDAAVAPEFISGQPEEIADRQPGTALFIATQDDFEALPETVTDRCAVVVEGKLGHKPYVAFTVPPPAQPSSK